MNKKMAYVDLDVHKNSITMALFMEQRKDEEWIKKIAHNNKKLAVYHRSGLLTALVNELTGERETASCEKRLSWRPGNTIALNIPEGI